MCLEIRVTIFIPPPPFIPFYCRYGSHFFNKVLGICSGRRNGSILTLRMERTYCRVRVL